MKAHLFIPFLLIAACATPSVKPALTPPKAPATSSKDPNMASIRSPEQLKAYPVGRYEDPNNPYIMHEGHTIYRAEEDAQWNLNPNVPTAVPLGPTVAVSDPAQQKSPVTAELEQKIQQQNQLIATTIEQNDRLSEEIKKLQGDQAEARESIAAKEQLQQQLSQKENELAETRKREAAEIEKNKPSVTPPPALSWWEKARNYFKRN